MPEKHLYEYAVIRIVPKVEREEFINVGVILFSKQVNFIKMRYAINENRLRVFSPELDIDDFREHMEASVRSVPVIKREEQLLHWIFRSDFAG